MIATIETFRDQLRSPDNFDNHLIIMHDKIYQFESNNFFPKYISTSEKLV